MVVLEQLTEVANIDEQDVASATVSKRTKKVTRASKYATFDKFGQS